MGVLRCCGALSCSASADGGEPLLLAALTLSGSCVAGVCAPAASASSKPATAPAAAPASAFLMLPGDGAVACTDAVSSSSVAAEDWPDGVDLRAPGQKGTGGNGRDESMHSRKVCSAAAVQDCSVIVHRGTVVGRRYASTLMMEQVKPCRTAVPP